MSTEDPRRGEGRGSRRVRRGPGSRAADEPDGFDPYEQVADALEEKAARPEGATKEEAAPLPRPPTRAIMVALVVIMGAIFLRSTANPPPRLDPDCTTAAFVLSKDTTKVGSPVEWTVVGPAQDSFALAINARAVARDAGGRLRAEASAGAPTGSTQMASDDLVQPEGCRATGLFGVHAPPGRHAVTLFRLTGAGSEPVASRDLTVESPN